VALNMPSMRESELRTDLARVDSTFARAMNTVAGSMRSKVGG
jgi:hypothetical protein